MDHKYFLHFSFLAVLLGVFSILSPEANTSGQVISTSPSGTFSGLALLGLVAFTLILVNQYTVRVGEAYRLTNAVSRFPDLKRYARKAGQSEEMNRQFSHLARELKKGNTEAGLGKPGHVKGTDVFYLRADNGARLFYHMVGESTFEIVAEADKPSEDAVINSVRKHYTREWVG